MSILTLLDSDFTILTLLEGLHCEAAPVTAPITVARSCGGRRHTITWTDTADSYELYNGDTLLYSGALLTYSYTLTKAQLSATQTYTLVAINECGETEEVGTIVPLYTSADSCETTYAAAAAVSTTFTASDACDTDFTAPGCDEP